MGRVEARKVRAGAGLGIREFLSKFFGTDEIENKDILEEVEYIQSQDNVEKIEASIKSGEEKIQIEEQEKSFRERQRLTNSGGGGNANRNGKPELSKQERSGKSISGRS